tara:strand:+ start:436 stop:567 length:132 start_codon:yes stop_codon:yes gene_type:complete
MGIDEPTPMLGRDLSCEYENERVTMQYHENFAYEDKLYKAIHN